MHMRSLCDDKVSLNEKEQKELQRVLCEMLVEFDQICKRYKIRYFLGGGTLLGAIRHKGFIPWDDDIDLMLLRPDYEKLCMLPRNAFPKHLFLQTPKTDRGYHGDMAKLRLNGSEYRTEFSGHFSDMHQGIFIDIFVHDKTARGKTFQKAHIFLTALARSMVFHKWEGTPMQYYGKHLLLCRICTAFIRLMPMCVLQAFRECVYRLFTYSRSPYLYDGMGRHLQHGAFPEKWLKKTVKAKFEEHFFPIPWQYDSYLRYSYGDYMVLPGKAEREQHKIQKIDFGKYRNKRVERYGKRV